MDGNERGGEEGAEVCGKKKVSGVGCRVSVWEVRRARIEIRLRMFAGDPLGRGYRGVYRLKAEADCFAAKNVDHQDGAQSEDYRERCIWAGEVPTVASQALRIKKWPSGAVSPETEWTN